MADYTIFDKFPPTLKFNSEAPFKDEKLNDVYKKLGIFEKVSERGLALQQHHLCVVHNGASKDDRPVDCFYTVIQRKDNYKDDLVYATDENKTFRFEYGFVISLNEVKEKCIIEEGVFDTSIEVAKGKKKLIDGTVTILNWKTDPPLKGDLEKMYYLFSKVIHQMDMSNFSYSSISKIAHSSRIDTSSIVYTYDDKFVAMGEIKNLADFTTQMCMFEPNGFKSATFTIKEGDFYDFTDLTTHRCGITTVGQAKKKTHLFYGLCKAYYNDKLIFTGNFENGKPTSGTFTNPDTNIETTSVLGSGEYMLFLLKHIGILSKDVDFIVSEDTEAFAPDNSRKKRKIDADVDVYVDIEKLSKEIDEQRELKAKKYPEKEKITDIYDMTEDEAITFYKSKLLNKKKYDEKMKDWRLEMISRGKHDLLSKATLSSPPSKRKRK